MSLVKSYTSLETKVGVRTVGGIPRAEIPSDLIELADSGLIDQDILSFGEGAFVFQSENILLPNMVYPNLVKYNTLLGVNLNSKLLTPSKRKDLLVKFNDKLSCVETEVEISNLLGLDQVFQRLKQNNKDSLVETLEQFFRGTLNDKFNLSVDAYNSASEEELFFKLSLEPRLKIEDIFSDYIQAVLYENRIYRRAVGSEKMAFCPIESRLGSQMQWLALTLLNKIEILNTYIINSFIQLLEKEFEVALDEYLLEVNKVSGIDFENNIIHYFQNVTCPNGTAAILSGSLDGSSIFLAYLKEPTKFIPYLLNVNQSVYKDEFQEVHELSKIGSIISC